MDIFQLAFNMIYVVSGQLFKLQNILYIRYQLYISQNTIFGLQ